MILIVHTIRFTMLHLVLSFIIIIISIGITALGGPWPPKVVFTIFSMFCHSCSVFSIKNPRIQQNSIYASHFRSSFISFPAQFLSRTLIPLFFITCPAHFNLDILIVLIMSLNSSLLVLLLHSFPSQISP